MTHAREMLSTHPDDVEIDLRQVAEAIDVLADCASTCTQCADACLAEGDPTLARCIRLNLDCADICSATSRVVSRQTAHDVAVTRPLLEACIAACRSCAAECASHADHMEHCAICAEQCRRCEEACASLLATMA